MEIIISIIESKNLGPMNVMISYFLLIVYVKQMIKLIINIIFRLYKNLEIDYKKLNKAKEA